MTTHVVSKARIPHYEQEWRYLRRVIEADPQHWLNRFMRLNQLHDPSPEARASIVGLVNAATRVMHGTWQERFASRSAWGVEPGILEDLDAEVTAELAKQWQDESVRENSRVLASPADRRIERIDRLKEEIASQWTGVDPPTQQAVAEAAGKTVRWISEIARPFGGYRAVIETVRSNRN